MAVVVATVTDDVRLFDVPKLRVAAMKFTETARARIVKVRALGVASVASLWRGGGRAWSIRAGVLRTLCAEYAIGRH